MRQSMSRHLSSQLFALFVLVVATASAAIGTNVVSLAAASEAPTPGSELTGGWRFVRTPNPHGGPDAISIMHTADTSRSDLELAGLMIRCSSGGTEVVVVLLRAFSLRAKPHVLFGKPGHETQFEATIAPPGTAILVPGHAATLVNGLWQTQNDLFIRVIDGQTTVAGVVALAGLRSAFKALVTSCGPQ
jgi:hypothetical protein